MKDQNFHSIGLTIEVTNCEVHNLHYNCKKKIPPCTEKLMKVW